jgi:uncharacterized membrane protein YeaQ/YmgE (transglycosylase-associated protein family)
MTILAWIVIGLIAGASANYLVKGGFGLIASLVLGVIGAALGGWIFAQLTGVDPINQIDIWSIIVSIFGAVIVVGLAKVVLGRGGEG